MTKQLNEGFKRYVYWNEYKSKIETKNIDNKSSIQHIMKGKSVAAERFIRTLKNEIYKHMTAVSKNVYFDALDDIVGE